MSYMTVAQLQTRSAPSVCSHSTHYCFTNSAYFCRWLCTLIHVTYVIPVMFEAIIVLQPPCNTVLFLHSPSLPPSLISVTPLHRKTYYWFILKTELEFVFSNNFAKSIQHVGCVEHLRLVWTQHTGSIGVYSFNLLLLCPGVIHITEFYIINCFIHRKTSQMLSKSLGQEIELLHGCSM